MTVKRCVWCGNEYTGVRQSKYCYDCRLNYRRIYRQEHRNEMNANSRFYMRSIRGYHQKKEVVCKWCGRTFETYTLVQKYCNECRGVTV